MKIEEQILTVEQARHLQSLGLDMSDAAMCYIMSPKGEFLIFPTWEANLKNPSLVYTYTLQEVLDKLPLEIDVVKGYEYPTSAFLRTDLIYREIYYEFFESRGALRSCTGHTIMEAAYNMLCYVIKNGYLKEESR